MMFLLALLLFMSNSMLLAYGGEELEKGGHTSPLKKWTWIQYSFTDNELQSGSFSDLAKLTAAEGLVSNQIAFHSLIDTRTMGSYKITIQGDPKKNHALFDRIPNQDMSQPSVLKNFIQEVATSDPAEKYGLILGGHGCGWLFTAEENRPLFIQEVASAIRESGVHFEVVSFDSCLMSTMESVAELSGLSNFVTATENYCPWNGVISEKFLNLFDQHNTQEALYGVCEKFVQMNTTTYADPSDPRKLAGPDACDLNVWDPAKVKDLYHYLQEQYQLKKIAPEYQKDFAIDPSWPAIYDLYSIVWPSLQAPGEQQEFQRRFADALIHRSASKDTPDTFHGLGIVKWPIEENEENRWPFSPTYLKGTHYPNPFLPEHR
ncbi:MAG: hypothetical protein HQK52_20120 [Oligoflexia bacterium]|nr:hypothetical protein [Oligoflexia bacterium]